MELIISDNILFWQEVIPLLKENMANDCTCEMLARIRQYVGGLVLSKEKEHVRTNVLFQRLSHNHCQMRYVFCIKF